jgi:hypothetical protein
VYDRTDCEWPVQTLVAIAVVAATLAIAASGMILCWDLFGTTMHGRNTAYVGAQTPESSLPGSSATYYVSPTGSDSNLGTSPSSPWRTIAKLKAFQANLVPGDSVLLQRGGVWSEQLDITNMNGSSGFPITIGNYGTGNLPVIDGGQTSSATGRDYCIDALNTTFKWITIDGIECRNAYKQGMTFQAYSGRGTNGVGIVVQNSYIHHDGVGACASCGPTPAAESGYFNQLDAQDTTGVQFLNNTLDHLGGHNALNVHFDLGGPVVSGNVVGTVAPFCNHNCIDVKGPVGGQIKNNIVTCPGCNANTAAFYTENVYTSASDLTYTGNIAYNVPVGFQNQTGGTCQSSPCSIKAKYYNNTVYHSSQYAFYAGTCTNHTLDIQKNIFDGGAVAINSGCSTTWDYNDDGGVFAITGNPVGPHDLKQINPQYVNPAGGNFKPQNTTILNHGTKNPVTPFSHLGAGR